MSSMNSTPSGDRIHIGIFGRRNAGKSSVINAMTGQSLSIVSEVKGTTTDPVQKAMELLPLGPVVLIDTPGIDDEGELGALRVRRSYQMLNKSDLALLIIDGTQGFLPPDREMLTRIHEKKIPYLIVANKCDETPKANVEGLPQGEEVLWVSAKTGENIRELKDRLAALAPDSQPEFPIIADKINPMDFVVLVVPIDKAAPKGRLILPQQQTIRDILDRGAIPVVCRDTELSYTLKGLSQKPALVITDSQAFRKVSATVPQDILLTSFSILFSRHKGDLAEQIRGVRALDSLQDGDKILISEGCTHHRQCGDIGTEKLPKWIRQYTGKEVVFAYSSGTEFPEDLSQFRMVVHCGGCMLSEREMKFRIRCAADQGIPIANYGLIIAQTQGILRRSLQVFPEIAAVLEG